MKTGLCFCRCLALFFSALLWARLCPPRSSKRDILEKIKVRSPEDMFRAYPGPRHVFKILRLDDMEKAALQIESWAKSFGLATPTSRGSEWIRHLLLDAKAMGRLGLPQGRAEDAGAPARTHRELRSRFDIRAGEQPGRDITAEVVFVGRGTGPEDYEGKDVRASSSWPTAILDRIQNRDS